MFRTGSPYSPFFTSGLLSEPSQCSPSSSRSSSPEPPLPPRRGSLPTDSMHTRSPSSTDGSSAFYFTLQPKRDSLEYRSFLSLDLAESNSMRSASLKRKASSGSRGPSRSARAKKVFTVFAQIPEVSSTQLAPPHASLRLRHSRDSLRTIPSPKPAPSITLPDVPRQTPTASTPPRLPSIAVSPPLRLSLDRASQSAPSLVISRSSPPSTIYKAAHRDSISTSSVSTRVRKFNRSHALARLEGRSNSTRRKAMAKPIQRNFMSMSDDDESDSDVDTERVTLSTILEPEDVVFPTSSSGYLQGVKSAPIGGRFPSLALTQSSSSHRRKPSRTKDWFPLKSFIDLQGDEEMSRWSWRSFIEVASVS